MFRVLTPLKTVKSTNVLDPGGPDVFYDYEAVGEFTDNGLAAQINNPLNWLPENTYSVPPVILRYDAQGHPVTPATLLPTTNPAGYVMQPPLALTTIDAACELVGNHCISAIRVRVAGVVIPNQESWKHIQQVAQEIHQQTGLQVVVTLGSSPQPTLVYVPGVHLGELGAAQDIAPLGWVEERWIHIGVGLTYLNQLGSTRLLLLGAVLAVCLGYVVMAFSALVTAQRRDFAILSALGWRPWQPARLFLAQALLFALVGGLVGMGIAMLMITLLEAIPLWPVVVWTLPTMLVMALVSSLYPLWQLWHIQPAEILRAGSAVAPRRVALLNVPFWLRVSPIGMLAARNLTRSRPRTLVTMGSLFLSAVLLVLMVSSILALHQALTGTLLGNFVLLQTAVPQLAGCVFAVLLTFLSVADLLLLQVRERQQEIGLLQAVGWRPALVQRLFVQEGLALALIGTVPGVLVALGILAVQHTVQSTLPFPLVALKWCNAWLLTAANAGVRSRSRLWRTGSRPEYCSYRLGRRTLDLHWCRSDVSESTWIYTVALVRCRFPAVCLGYVVMAFSALVQHNAETLPSSVRWGWRPWQPARLFLAQALLFALVGGLVGMGIAMLLITLPGGHPALACVVWTLPTMLVMALVSSLYPLWQLWHIQPAEILRAGSQLLLAEWHC